MNKFLSVESLAYIYVLFNLYYATSASDFTKMACFYEREKCKHTSLFLVQHKDEDVYRLADIPIVFYATELICISF